MANFGGPRLFLLVPALIVLYFSFQIFLPFLFPISMALVFTSLTFPGFQWVCDRLKGRRTLASLLTCLAITTIILVPSVLCLIQLTQEVAAVYERVQSFVESTDANDPLILRQWAYVGPLVQWLEQYVDFKQADLVGGLVSILRQVSFFFIRHSTVLLSGLVQMITGFFIMIATMFFLFRDGPKLAHEVRRLLPISDQYQRLVALKFRDVASATVLGNLLTALSQGFTGGLVFWILGIPNAFFWGAMTALFSLVPVVGTALVWVPWAIYFFATGAFIRAIILVLLEVLIVGTIDNVLRPLFIEGRTKMHTLVVFFSIMGGIGYFGIAGMILGPIIVAIGLTFLELYRIEFEPELSRSRGS